MKKANTEIVIKALAQGRTVDIGLQYPVFIGEVDGGKLLCFDYSEDCNPVCDINVGTFISACDKIPEDQVFLLAANIALTDINRKVRSNGIPKVYRTKL